MTLVSDSTLRGFFRVAGSTLLRGIWSRANMNILHRIHLHDTITLGGHSIIFKWCFCRSYTYSPDVRFCCLGDWCSLPLPLPVSCILHGRFARAASYHECEKPVSPRLALFIAE